MSTGTNFPWLNWLNDIYDGKRESPAVWRTMGFTLSNIESDKVIFMADPDEDFINPNGTIQGGWIAALMDASMSAVVAIRLPSQQLCTTIEIKVNYVKTVTLKSGTLRALGEIVHQGGRIAVAKGTLLDRNDNIVAYATTTCLIIKTSE